MTLLRYMVIQILWAYSSQAEVPVCEHPPEVDFGDILSGEKSEYVESDRVQYCCYPGYTLAGSEWITCNGGSWTQLPKCLAPCTITKQQLEEKNLFLRNNRRRTVIVLSAQTVEFSCSKDYNLTVPAVRTCVDGNIHFPLCIPQTGKKCGRPPAIDNGDITMFSQKDYASGSSVEYKCQHFYTLDGQNTSFCNNGNWTTPPVCVEPCAVSVTEMESHDIELSKRSKGKQYIPHGDFVEFKCKLGYAPPALLSTSDFTVQCYSGNISYPQCHKEITCTPPTILNGGVMVPWRLYKENEQIQFNCDIGFKFNERSDAVCTEDGWRPAPLCIEVTCDPPKVADGSFVPSKTIYREEDVITVDCKRGFHFDSFSGNTAQCTKNGWIPVPKCVLRPCDYPQVENIELSGYYQSNREQAFPAKIGSSTYYRCANGYVTATEENWVLIRCTRDGWDPAPKCIKLCSVPDLENGGTGYWHWKKFKEGETISYSCHRGYIPENQQDRIMCAKDGWSPTPRCIPENTCKKVEITHGYFTEKKDIFNLNEETTYRCVIGYTTPDGNETGNTRCIHTRWSPSPGCSKTCTRPNLENILLKTNKTVFSLGHDLIYECVAGYQTIHKITIDYTVCGRNGWIPEPQCLAIECEMLTLPNGEMSPREGKYHNGDVVTFSCAKGYTRVGPDSAQCYYFGWSPTPPLCKDELRFCEQPPAIHNGSIISECQQQYPHGSTMEYRCNHRFKMIGSSKIECIDGAWSPLPSCTEAKKKCPPPPQVPGALKVTEMRNYESGEEIPFQCLENFEASAEVDKIMCKDGKWQSPPRCIEKYVCRSPRPLENGKLRQEHQNLGMEQSGPITYPDDAVLEYTCNTGFVLNGRSEIICNMGTWTAAPTCDEMPCGKVPSVLHSLPRRGEKNHYKAGITVRYECKRGFKIHGEQNIICQAGNWTKPPTCEEFFGKCGPPPAIENGDITSFPLKQYDQDSRVEYKCQHLYVMEGSQFATCNVGEWTEPPTCIEPCTVSEEDLEKNNIKLKWTPVGKLYSASGDFIDFVCKEGYVKDPTSPPFRVQCLKGKLSYPQCSL